MSGGWEYSFCSLSIISRPVNKLRAYGGASGNRIHMQYQGNGYMLKFPPKPRRGGEMSYTNGCISEYLACHIFAALGFQTQETLLGTTDKRGKEKRVVACRDFTDDGRKIIEFAQEDRKKIFYFDFISSLKDPDCTAALERVFCDTAGNMYL